MMFEVTMLSGPVRTLRNIVGGLAVVLLSFWLTLLFMDNWSSWTQSDIDVAMQKAGLTYAKTGAIAGYIDKVQRDPGGRLVLTGWAVDKAQGQPVTIFALIDSKFEPVAVTNGPRPDVTKALNMPAEQTKNVAFTGHTPRAVDCNLADSITVVGVNQKKQMSTIADEVLIPGCR
jgi:hypothetical protein